MTDQQPPYEDIYDDGEPIDLDKRAPFVPLTPGPRRQGAQPRPGEVTSRELIPDLPQPWNEARIMRLGALVVGSLFLMAFVVAAANVLVHYAWWLVWLPFLVGALPYLGFFAMAWRKHLDDESQSRTRRENFAHSRFDAQFTPLANQPANTERWPQ
jgi:hypothetical protein